MFGKNSWAFGIPEKGQAAWSTFVQYLCRGSNLKAMGVSRENRERSQGLNFGDTHSL